MGSFFRTLVSLPIAHRLCYELDTRNLYAAASVPGSTSLECPSGSHLVFRRGCSFVKYEKACSDFTENEWRTISETGQGKGYGYHLKGHRLPNVLALICEGKQSCNVDILLEFLDEPFRCVNNTV